MGLEASTTIEGLRSDWPVSGDPVSQGDDHLTLIKKVLESTFPGVGGGGFNRAILATEDELDMVIGARANLQVQIDAIEGSGQLSAPVGTTMLFIGQDGVGNYVPEGWTLVASNNDSMLRIVSSGSGSGDTGGNMSPINASFAHSHTTGDFQLELAHLPNPTGNIRISLSSASQSDAHDYTTQVARGNTSASSGAYSAPMIADGYGHQNHNHGSTGTATSSFTPRYLNAVQGRKL